MASNEDPFKDPPPTKVNLRSFLPSFNPAAFNPLGAHDLPTRLRRLAIATILTISTLSSIVSIFNRAFTFSRIPRIIITIICFFFSAYFLQKISRMRGERVVGKVTLARRDYDILLGALVAVEIALMGWIFGGLKRGPAADVWYALELTAWLAPWVAGWIAGRCPLEEVESAWSHV